MQPRTERQLRCVEPSQLPEPNAEAEALAHDLAAAPEVDRDQQAADRAAAVLQGVDPVPGLQCHPSGRKGREAVELGEWMSGSSC